ncbi:MAG: bifunctional (p)ppGpp synthetase/guanosine-3',5'-bis(diphosphate) 3'-pyrophosphohydrolase [Clostridiales bacterium]|nr:bifunctional (p)ppGpp synthetase/guanosine-3',5'-bis(diphosphate) 3'-pyrophosphohydrolase [Clostridiales bacterium]MCD7827625.1 bifunctional (p)ppGpp synthetase/guanosine-3',5'-bis(diphosphate) 3'-pyrophosphohydrolase [Clostridiales bacterium]
MSEAAEKTGRELYEQLRVKFDGTLSPENIAVIDKAFNLANEAHGDQKRKSGEPYIIHPVAVASILFDELGMDMPSIAAALLHDVVEDTHYEINEIKDLFGDEIALLVDGVTKINRVQITSREEQQAENLRKMLIAMSRDIRVIIIKLADRVHNIRTLQYVPEEKRRMTAKETLEIYAPIAHRLGIRAFKEELEDKSISFLDPVAYKDIEQRLEQQEPQRKEFLHSVQSRISERVHESVKDAKIDGRIKSVHGIYRKMYIGGKSFDEIYDIYAVRIIVDTVVDCYNCLGIVHDMFHSIPGRFKDYISTPKPNMYQSLHTTLLGRDGIPFEVQIRTWEMHKNAEYGIAAHWKYKMGRQDRDVDNRLLWIRQMLESQQESGNAGDIVQDIKSDLVPEEVYVLTPKGTVICLPMGATVIDFAYAIHSAVGNKMTGAKVDGRIVPIDYQVKTGEIVEILTSSQPGKGPSRDWLKIVKTSAARAKIRSWFKKEKREENISEGKSEFERELRKSNIRLDDEQMSKLLETLSEKQRQNSVDDFYAAIGYGGISVARLMPQIRDEYNKMQASSQNNVAEIKLTKPKRSSGEGIIVEGIDNCLVKLSKCCSPIPGDDVIGFITRGHGVSVHKRDCPNVPADITTCAEPERWINVRWEETENKGFNATLAISCIDRMSLLADVSVALANMHVMIHNVNTRDPKDGTLLIYMTIAVNNAEHLKGIIAKLMKINGILKIDRSGS